MRELKIRFELSGGENYQFDVQLWEDGEWHEVGTMTPERLHNFMRFELNKVIDSL